MGGVQGHVFPAGSTFLNAHLFGLLPLDDALDVSNVSLLDGNHFLDDLLLLLLDHLQDSFLLGKDLSLNLNVVSLKGLGKEFHFV